MSSIIASNDSGSHLPIPRRKVVKIVFISLLFDLLAFTIPLPLFPRLIDSFVRAERSQVADATLLSSILRTISTCRTTLTSWRSAPDSTHWSTSNNSKWDVTILGGILGSIFSFCQFLISPLIGRLSDTYGRRPVLLLSLVGNILSALLWLTSTSFGRYVLSRAVGGLSEGNVQLSIAVISDVSDPTTRAQSLDLVGIAFSLCFTFGPILGAWFAMRSPPVETTQLIGVGLNVYAFPAAITLLLLVIETIYLVIALPETKQLRSSLQHKIKPSNEKSTTTWSSQQVLEQRRRRLGILARVHTSFLFFFSGAEFTLTFLTYDLYGFTNSQNGRLLGFIGILSSILQGGYTRRSKSPPLRFVKSGIQACVMSLVLLSILPVLKERANGRTEGEIDRLSLIVLYCAASLLAYVSASVVNSLNTLASLECDEDQRTNGMAAIPRGKTLGEFRSAGQLGRALGPLFATGLYWSKGPRMSYTSCGIGSCAVLLFLNRLDRSSTPDTSDRPKDHQKDP